MMYSYKGRLTKEPPKNIEHLAVRRILTVNGQKITQLYRPVRTPSIKFSGTMCVILLAIIMYLIAIGTYTYKQHHVLSVSYNPKVLVLGNHTYLCYIANNSDWPVDISVSDIDYTIQPRDVLSYLSQDTDPNNLTLKVGSQQRQLYVEDWSDD